MHSFNIQRRSFLKKGSALLALSQFGWAGLDALYPSSPYRVGLIGTGWYGKSDLFRLMQVADVHVVALCDVDQHMLQEASQLIQARNTKQKAPQLYNDHQRMLAEHELDLVLIGTPDHWHALQAIDAIRAGAHVYLQKPISVDVLEGEAIVRAARKHDRVVQIGTQRRSTEHLIHAKKHIVEFGLLGKIAHVEMCCYYHMRANENPPIQSVPDFFDYDRWAGPAPKMPFVGLPHRKWWRARMEYSNGIMGDMCVHMFDTVRWMLGLGWPKKINSTGGIYVQTESLANTPDTQTALFEYSDLNLRWQHRSWGTPPDPEYPWAFFIYGEKGTLKGSVWKYEFIPHDKDQEILKREVLMEREKFPEDLSEKAIELHAAPATRQHHIDFLHAITTNSKPVADVMEGHISSASCILANLSMQVNRPLIYDPANASLIEDPEAEALLRRDYQGAFIHPF